MKRDTQQDFGGSAEDATIGVASDARGSPELARMLWLSWPPGGLSWGSEAGVRRQEGLTLED